MATRKAFLKLFGDKAGIAREKNPVITDGGKVNREMVSKLADEVVETHKVSATNIKVGITGYGKTSVVDVDPKLMKDFSLVSKLSAVAAENPVLSMRSPVVSTEVALNQDGIGDVIADFAGGIVGLSADEADTIKAAGKLGKHGYALEKALDALDAEIVAADAKLAQHHGSESREDSANTKLVPAGKLVG